jgi:hypothetical protein
MLFAFLFAVITRALVLLMFLHQLDLVLLKFIVFFEIIS